jgi:hypothetical protein
MGTSAWPVLAVRVHPDRGAWVVRWRDQDLRRRRGFGSRAEAPAFAEGLERGLHSWLPQGRLEPAPSPPGVEL